MHYFVDACRLLQVATILLLRCGDRMAPAKRRVLARFVRGSPRFDGDARASRCARARAPAAADDGRRVGAVPGVRMAPSTGGVRA